MACCCTNIKTLACRLSVCGGEINTGMIANMNGTYKLVLDFQGTDFIVNAEIVNDDPIIFPVQDLNEAYKFIGKVYDPNGDLLTLTEGESVYDCFSFTTGMSYEVNPVLP